MTGITQAHAREHDKCVLLFTLYKFSCMGASVQHVPSNKQKKMRTMRTFFHLPGLVILPHLLTYLNEPRPILL